MSLDTLYALPDVPMAWAVPQNFNATFDWRFGAGNEALLALYGKGKARQWDPAERIDWSLELDPENPQQLPPQMLPLHDAPVFARLPRAAQIEVRRHYQAWSTSQFLQGEQGALLCAAKIVQQVPDLESKLYAATQVVDEARHVEIYKKLIEKMGIAYPITPALRTLIDQILRDGRWDMTYLGMQVVIEGLALAAFARIRDNAQNPLAAAVNTYVMEDEARHVAFGRLALKGYYPELGAAERAEREEFLVEACHLMRDQLNAEELWRGLDLPVEECVAHMNESGTIARFRANLFGRIVPVVKDIGLLGDVASAAFADMGIIGYAAFNASALQAEDERLAAALDRLRAYVDGMIRAAE